MYLWLKAFHVIAVMAWMAGMLYLPRLFVYHCAAEVGSTQSETFKLMERRLLNETLTPTLLGALALIAAGVAVGTLGGRAKRAPTPVEIAAPPS